MQQCTPNSASFCLPVMSSLVDQNIFCKKSILSNISIRLSSRSENGSKQVIAVVNEKNEVIIHYSNGDNVPVVKTVFWFSESERTIQGVCFDPSGTWLLVVTQDGSLCIIPALSLVDKSQKVDCKWSLSDVTHFARDSKSPTTKPTAVIWWQTLECNQNAIVAYEGGELSFVSLTDGQNIGNCSVHGTVISLSICQDNCLDSITLLITNRERLQWRLLLEQKSSGFIWSAEANPKVPTLAEFAALSTQSDENKGRSRLQGLKQLSVDKFAFLKRIVDSRGKKSEKNEDIPSTTSSDSSSSDGSNPEKLLAETYLTQQYARSRYLFSGLYKPSSLLMIYGAEVSEAPLHIHKIPPNCQEALVTERLLFIASDDLSTIFVLSTDLSECKSNCKEEFNVDALVNKFTFDDPNEKIISIYKASETPRIPDRSESEMKIKRAQKSYLFQSAQDVDMPKPKVDSCIVVTTCGIYKIQLSEPLVEKIIKLVIDSDDLESAERLAIIFALNWQQLLEVIGDLLLQKRQFGRAISLYQMSRCRLLKYVLKIAVAGQSNELLNFITVCLESLISDLSLPTRIHLSNIAVMAYTEILLRNFHISLQRSVTLKKFVKFLSFNEHFDQILAVNIVCQTALWPLVIVLARIRGLSEVIIKVICNNLSAQDKAAPRSLDIADKNFHTCISDPVFIMCLLQNQNVNSVFFNFLKSQLNSLDVDILHRYTIMLDPSQTLLRPIISKLFLHRNLRRYPSSSLESTMDSVDIEITDDLITNTKVLIETFLEALTVFLSKSNAHIFDIGLQDKLNFAVIEENPVPVNTVRTCLLSAGFGHVGLIRNNALYTWGSTGAGCLGCGPSISKTATPTQVETLAHLPVVLINVSCGKLHTLVLTNYGIYAWGSNAFGQLGLEPVMYQTPYPCLISSLADIEIVDVKAGQYHSLALSADGKVYSWGWGVHGQLGHGNVENIYTPENIAFLKKFEIVQIAAGHAHSIVLTSQGDVYSFGSNAFGQLGLGNTTRSSMPVKVALLPEKIRLIETSYFHNLAITGSNCLYIWGASPQSLRLTQAQKKSRALQHMAECEEREGTGTEPSVSHSDADTNAAGKATVTVEEDQTHLSPSLVNITNVDGPIVQICTGCHHSALLSKNGTVYTWGKNLDGQIGNATRKEVLIPTALKTNPISSANVMTLNATSEEDLEILKCTQIVCGAEFTVAVDCNGKVLAWGNNGQGQLGRSPEKDNKSLDGKLVLLKNTKRIIKLPNTLQDGVDYPREITNLPSLQISFKSCDTAYRYKKHLPYFIPLSTIEKRTVKHNDPFKLFLNHNGTMKVDSSIPLYGQKTLHFALETYCNFYDHDNLLSVCFDCNNYQACSKISLLGGHFIDSLNFDLIALKECLIKSDWFANNSKTLTHLTTSQEHQGVSSCSVVTSASLESMKQFGDDIENQGGQESLYDDVSDELSQKHRQKSALKQNNMYRIFTLSSKGLDENNPDEMCSETNANNYSVSTDFIRKTVIEYVESLDVKTVDADPTPIPKTSKLLAAKLLSEAQNTSNGLCDTKCDEASIKENVYDLKVSERLLAGDVVSLATQVVETHLGKPEIAENQILAQNVMLKVLEFWFSNDLPSDVLETVLLKFIEKYFISMAILLFCKNFNNNLGEQNGSKSEANKKIFLSRFSTKFCLQLCSIVLEKMNKA